MDLIRQLVKNEGSVHDGLLNILSGLVNHATKAKLPKPKPKKGK
jgi:hypothetical protein